MTERKSLKEYEEQLKPCPFCGKKVKLYASANGKGYNASCRNTECRILVITEAFDSPDKAIEVWNKRFEFEEWHGMNGVTYAPKGTFEKIFNDPDDGEDI